MGDAEIRNPKQTRSIEKRNKIKRAGLELFINKGYFNTSSNEIAKLAEVSIGSFYSYFSDKKDLIMELINDYYAEALNQIPENSFENCKNPKEVVKAYVSIAFKVHDYLPEFHKEMVVLAQRDEDIQKMDGECNKQMLDKILAIMMNNQSLLRVQDVNSAVFIIQHSLESVVHAVKLYHYPCNEQAIIEQFSDMICRYVMN